MVVLLWWLLLLWLLEVGWESEVGGEGREGRLGRVVVLLWWLLPLGGVGRVVVHARASWRKASPRPLYAATRT